MNYLRQNSPVSFMKNKTKAFVSLAVSGGVFFNTPFALRNFVILHKEWRKNYEEKERI